VWDIAIDGAFDLGSGVFQSTDAAAASAVAFYAAGNTSLADYIYKLSDSNPEQRVMGRQDVIIVTPPPIPEPSTYALMLAGIAAVGFVARRRSNRA
jgi:PEP-CTERM motif